jgi:transcriptional regulator with XRE-family HTH domain
MEVKRFVVPPTKEELASYQKNLKKLRLGAGLTLNELGSMLGMSRQNVWMLENSKINITMTHYWALHYIYDHIFGETEYAAKDS